MYVVLAVDKHILYECNSLQDSSNYVEDVRVSVRWVNYCFRIFVKHHFSGNCFFRKAICKYYLLYFSPELGIEFCILLLLFFRTSCTLQLDLITQKKTMNTCIKKYYLFSLYLRLATSVESKRKNRKVMSADGVMTGDCFTSTVSRDSLDIWTCPLL